MKKITALFISLSIVLLGLNTVFAIDICTDDPFETVDYNVEITSAVYLRDLSCMDSNIITTIPQGEVVHVMGKIEGWHKIERTDGNTGWIWETFVTNTDKPFESEHNSEPAEEEPKQDPMYDVDGHSYEEAILYVYERGIVEGYPDGSFQPDRKVNRAELLKVIVESAYENEFGDFENESCFNDVPATEWYSQYVCFAENENIVEGYFDGSFRPANNINFVEATKIILIGFGYEYVEGDPWYENILEIASSNNYTPADIYSFDQEITRAQVAEMIANIMKAKE